MRRPCPAIPMSSRSFILGIARSRSATTASPTPGSCPSGRLKPSRRPTADKPRTTTSARTWVRLPEPSRPHWAEQLDVGGLPEIRRVTAEASCVGRDQRTMTSQLDRGGPPGSGLRPELAHLPHTGVMTLAQHQPWCTHHHHVDLTNRADPSIGGAEDWCCYRGPRDSTGRRIEITDHNRFLGVKIRDWVCPAEPHDRGRRP